MINENVSFQTVEYMQQRIEELQKENMGLFSRNTIDVFVKEAYADGKDFERAKIVAWLRGRMSDAVMSLEPVPNIDDLADEIEAGEHLK